MRSSHKVEVRRTRTCVGDTNGVDELVEETCGTTPPLEHCNAFGAGVEGEELDKER